ncbi:hypothetical protein GCM10027280_27410 [Micromonospora polyrhachis]|uniref:Uncharacterized protein n=1 Tax=Micromonospora polyrhachis TaxID=1282883 RepID=A0A7W7SN30_9ACTN|nr:hypothetical protein [Micromonospora polyrhachis]MBB4957833.1 hypothetical protein [Micromonospora polyrhachis]
MSESSSAQAKHSADEQPPASAAPDEVGAEFVPATSAGMPPTAQTFFAVVTAGGALVRGFGVVSSARLSTGTYQVVFSHDVTGSAYIGTLGLPGNVGTSPSGEIAVVGRSGVANGVFVQTFTSAGAAADRAFHLAVLS